MFKNKIKVIAIFIGCLLFRLIPFRAPNVEPIMASIMPLGRKFGALWAFLFGFASIFLYDLLTHFGPWTLIVGITYGFVGLASFFYFKRFQASIFNFVIFSFFATIVFDAITGILFAPIFGQTMWNAFVLQIPFTALHLAGNIGFAITLSPLMDKWLVSEQLFPFKKNSSLSGVKV